MNEDYLKFIAIAIMLLFLIYGFTGNHIRTFMTTVYDATTNQAKTTVYGGDTVYITTALRADKFDELKSELAGGEYANCCDHAFIRYRIVYPDGYYEFVDVDKGMLCTESILGAKITYTIKKDHGKGKLYISSGVYCKEKIDSQYRLFILSSDTEIKGSEWYVTYYPRNPCEGVVCEPYCEGYTWYGDGECVPSGESYWCYYHTVEENSPKCGWKDSDGDGVPDWEDECPNQAGPAKFNGCPDSDGDGIPDNKDACPNEYGEAKYNGCPPPDSDGDGIPDDVDKCPYQPGLPQFDGCPDSDGDGIPDNEDACPYEPGVPEEHGCPPKNVTTIAAPTPSENVTAPSPTEVSPPPEEVTPTPGVVRPSAPYVPPSGAYEEEEVKRPVCGNGICEPSENILNCPKDCLSKATVINAVLVAIIVILVIVILLRK